MNIQSTVLRAIPTLSALLTMGIFSVARADVILMDRNTNDGSFESNTVFSINQSPTGTDQENSTSFDQMAGAIWRSVTLGFFLLFLWKQLSKFVFFLFFLRFLPRFWDRSGKRSQSLQIMGAIWRDWYGCVLPRVSLEIIFQKSLL